MIFLAKTLGILLCGFGIFVAALPDKARTVMSFWKEGSRAYGIGMIRLTVGIIVLLASPHAHVPGVAAIVGILFVLSGAIIFVVGPEKIKELIAWWEGHPDHVIRLVGFVALTFGLLVLYSL